MERIEDGDLAVIVAGPAGFANNIYIVIDRATNEAAFIDAPAEPEQSIAAAEWAGVRPGQILLTHGHGDHTASIDILKSTFDAKLVAEPTEPGLSEGQMDQPVRDGDEVRVGNLVFGVIAVPGHTPASIAFLHRNHLFSGDTLFPGGPGHSRTNEKLQQEIDSITSRLYPLADATVVYTGHGNRTTIGESKAEYAVFAGKPHDPDLHGDVLWLES